MKKIVLRPFQAGDKILQPGTIVEVSKWRNVATLERNRYLSDAPKEVSKVTVLNDK